MVPEKWRATDGETDRKSDTQRWVPNLKTQFKIEPLRLLIEGPLELG